MDLNRGVGDRMLFLQGHRRVRWACHIRLSGVGGEVLSNLTPAACPA